MTISIQTQRGGLAENSRHTMTRRQGEDMVPLAQLHGHNTDQLCILKEQGGFGVGAIFTELENDGISKRYKN